MFGGVFPPAGCLRTETLRGGMGDERPERRAERGTDPGGPTVRIQAPRLPADCPIHDRKTLSFFATALVSESLTP